MSLGKKKKRKSGTKKKSKVSTKESAREWLDKNIPQKRPDKKFTERFLDDWVVFGTKGNWIATHERKEAAQIDAWNLRRAGVPATIWKVTKKDLEITHSTKLPVSLNTQRTFNGKKYFSHMTDNRKTWLQKRAKHLRERGYRTRVTRKKPFNKKFPFYVLWVAPQKGVAEVTDFRYA